MKIRLFVVVVSLLYISACSLHTKVSKTASHQPYDSDLVLTGAKIYGSSNSARFNSMAILEGKVAYIGDTTGLQHYIGKKTVVRQFDGQVILPGLIDAHIHPLDILDLDVCNINGHPMTLKELTVFVMKCITHYKVSPGNWLRVHQWNFASGNQPTSEIPTIRAALDLAAPKNPVALLGIDGLHNAYNSFALKLGKNKNGKTVGITKKTLAQEFSLYKKLIGTDDVGEPNGRVNQNARFLIDPNPMLYSELDAVYRTPEKIVQRLNGAGITAFLDAMASPDGLRVYDKLYSSGKMTARATLAMYFNPSLMGISGGQIDLNPIVNKANKIRSKYLNNPFISADTVKLFIDGSLEGDPFATPPKLPTAANLNPYHQPIFSTNTKGELTLIGYVDTETKLCEDVRSSKEKYSNSNSIKHFHAEYGFYPAQCELSNGQLQYDRQVIMEFAKQFHIAGFNLHIHVSGDMAVRTALDAIEAARKTDGNLTTRDTLAHVQLAHPNDVIRIGKNRLFTAYTYAWIGTDTEYDSIVIPFIQKTASLEYNQLHSQNSYYEKNSYPVLSSKVAGAIITAGSDAPVFSKDPRPFLNMARSVTRSYEQNLPALNPRQSITIRDALAAYTINGAKQLGREKEIGSLEVGKSADFIVIDRDIVALGESGKIYDVEKTQVLETWFQGKQVFKK